MAQQIRVARAPLRVSMAGGGTDIEPYCSEYGGCVVAGAIQYYAQAIYPSSPVIVAEMEQVIMDYFHLKEVVKITNGAPQMSGLGGSAACFVVGIKAVRPDMPKDEIAALAFHLERNDMGIKGGKQDQYISAYGGLNYIEFGATVKVESLKIPVGFEDLLLLVYMGKRKEMGEDIIQDQMQRYHLPAFHRQKAIAYSMKAALSSKDLISFGKLLDEAWRVKVQYSPYISNADINTFYADCLKNGAIGGKLTGAGGGGYMLLMEHPDKAGQLRTYLKKYESIRFDTAGVITEGESNKEGIAVVNKEGDKDNES